MTATTAQLDFSEHVLDTEQPADYIRLLKPKVMVLVTFVGLAGIVAAPVQQHLFLQFLTLLCIAVGAGSAGAFNMWYERHLDSKMRRTSKRPIPAGKIDPDNALAFSIVMHMGSVMLLGVFLNWLAAGLLFFAGLFYAFVYTVWLKPRTAQNIVIGGLAGALPPLIGWTAMTGTVDTYPILMVAIIFMWTPPHFWALSLFTASDYQKVGIPMLPNVIGKDATKTHMLIYTILLAVLSLVPYVLGYVGWFYGLLAVLFNGVFVISAIAVKWNLADHADKKMFGFSIVYLFMIFTALMIDTVPLG